MFGNLFVGCIVYEDGTAQVHRLHFLHKIVDFHGRFGTAELVPPIVQIDAIFVKKHPFAIGQAYYFNLQAVFFFQKLSVCFDLF